MPNQYSKTTIPQWMAPERRASFRQGVDSPPLPQNSGMSSLARMGQSTRQMTGDTAQSLMNAGQFAYDTIASPLQSIYRGAQEFGSGWSGSAAQTANHQNFDSPSNAPALNYLAQPNQGQGQPQAPYGTAQAYQRYADTRNYKNNNFNAQTPGMQLNEQGRVTGYQGQGGGTVSSMANAANMFGPDPQQMRLADIQNSRAQLAQASPAGRLANGDQLDLMSMASPEMQARMQGRIQSRNQAGMQQSRQQQMQSLRKKFEDMANTKLPSKGNSRFESTKEYRERTAGARQQQEMGARGLQSLAQGLSQPQQQGGDPQQMFENQVSLADLANKQNRFGLAQMRFDADRQDSRQDRQFNMSKEERRAYEKMSDDDRSQFDTAQKQYSDLTSQLYGQMAAFGGTDANQQEMMQNAQSQAMQIMGVGMVPILAQQAGIPVSEVQKIAKERGVSPLLVLDMLQRQSQQAQTKEK